MSKKIDILAEYIKSYRVLISKRAELDARIDFVETLISSYDDFKDQDFRIQFYDKIGNVVKELSNV